MSVLKALEKMFNSKGLSTVIATIIMILLTVMAMVVVGTFVKNMLNKQMEKTDCLDAIDKILLDDSKTCYNQSSNELKFFMEIKDIEINEVLVSISDNEMSKTFQITNTPQILNTMKNYSNQKQSLIYLPSAKSGFAYYINLTEAGLSKPLSIKIIPVLNDNSCESTDQINSISLCN